MKVSVKFFRSPYIKQKKQKQNEPLSRSGAGGALVRRRKRGRKG